MINNNNNNFEQQKSAAPFFLSKTQYCKGRRCLKSLWLNKYKKNLANFDNEFIQLLIEQGNEVSKLARSYFEGGTLIEENHKNIHKAIIRTKKLINASTNFLFEAAFIYENVLVRVDILRNNYDGTWDLIEVKSSNNVIPKIHYDDVAIQKWVLINCGIKIKNTYIMHLNRKYIRKKSLEVKKIFILKKIDERISEHFRQIPDFIKKVVNNIKNNKTTEPKEIIGSKCKNPHKCEFYSYCWKDIKSGSIYELSRMNDLQRNKLLEANITYIQDIVININKKKSSQFSFSPKQDIEIKCNKLKKNYIDDEKISLYFKKLSYPLYFLDYESISYAVPKYEGDWPHKHIIIQYSLHIQKDIERDIIHKYYLHNESSFPSYHIVKNLLNDINDDGGSIIVFHKNYEKDRTKDLMRQFPHFSDRLQNIIDRMWDLEVIFAKRWYWDKGFKGSNSIKNILPVFAEKLSYSDLEIKRGDIVQKKYLDMISLPINSLERENLKRNLLKYCERDTLAMVTILNKLIKKISVFPSSKVAS